MALRVIGGALVVTSFVMFAVNVFATVVVRRHVEVPGERTPLLPVDAVPREAGEVSAP